MNLKNEQQRLYALMPAESHCFVRVCDHDHALWVSDLPRRSDDCESLTCQLKEQGFFVKTDEKTGLWLIDWTQTTWEAFQQKLPKELTVFPLDEKYHEAYALCRLLLLHPTEMEPHHMPALRRMIKLTAAQPAQMLKKIRILHEEAAVMLRKGQSLPHAAGRVLAAWLAEQTTGKETNP